MNKLLFAGILFFPFTINVQAQSDVVYYGTKKTRCVLDSAIYTHDTILVDLEKGKQNNFIYFKVTSTTYTSFDLNGDCGPIKTYTLYYLHRGQWTVFYTNENSCKLACGLGSCSGTSAPGLIYRHKKFKKGSYYISSNVKGKTLTSAVFKL